MQPEKLDRNQQHRINANPGDRLYLWDSSSEKQNLTIRSKTDNDVLAVYGITPEQLACLYSEIAHVLGKSPEPTLYHLRQIHESVGKLIQAADVREPEDVDDGFTGKLT